MGAQPFQTVGRGKNAQEAYRDANDDASAENGHQDGYSGDIQTCAGFKGVKLKKGHTIEDAEEEICENNSYNGKRFEKWGNCACFYIGKGQYVFIGWGAC